MALVVSGKAVAMTAGAMALRWRLCLAVATVASWSPP